MIKIKRSKVLILGVFIYLIFQISLVFAGNNVQTLTLETQELKANLTTKGVLIREEILINSDESGKLERIYDEGEKIKKSEEIASVYMNKNVEKINSELEKIKKEITSIIKELESENNNISKELKESQLKTKKEQRKILESKKENQIFNVKTDISGIISYKYDGKEEKYNLEKLEKISKEDIEKEENDYKEIQSNNSIKKGEPVARIINNYATYLAISVDEEESKNFSVGQSVKIVLKDEEIDGKVDKIQKNSSDIVVIFKITTQNVGIYDTRVEEFDIIYKQIEGLKIPNSSIQIVDEKKGVYVINEQTQDPEFIELQGIEYEDEEFVFIDYYKNKVNGTHTVSLYDEIILKPNVINKNIKMK
ncbi:MAG: HlyD family efflux transporter periplasmic adaptor subunit [Romboutsia sp.]|uniref:HlyD family efflux transporter periplasmic adaptor subunit n=1 Tax=Romboutsia sp. TaxID=1965302 RepID=UPI003F33B217